MPERDEGDVHRGQGYLPREKVGGRVPEIDPLPYDDSRVAAERVVQKGLPHVDRIDLRCAPLQKTVREAPGGSPHVDRHGSRDGHSQILKGPGELLPSPRDERARRRGDRNLLVGSRKASAFRDDLSREENATGKD